MRTIPLESSENNEPRIGVLRCTPSLTPEQLSNHTEGMDVVVLIAFATGTTPDRLAPIIKKRIEEGVPVILLTDNPADPAGPSRLAYSAGQSALEAGAILLQKANVNHTEEVIKTVQEAFREGLCGTELSEHIQEIYSYQEGEKAPSSDWSRRETIEWQRQHTRNALKRMGLSGEQLEEAMKEWESGLSKF